MPVLTYDEIAEHFGISGPSARNLVRRKGWRRTIGNDKKARIVVPDEKVNDAPPMAGQVPPSFEPFEAQIVGLQALVEAERRRADTAERMAAEAQADRDRWHALATKPLWRRIVGA